jgi:hypothetical protein
VAPVFKINDKHQQQHLMDSTHWMNPRIKKKLENSWAPIFYEHVFCKIDEKPFSVLYGTTGNPNFPVNILLSLEYIKHMRNCSDLELLDDFYFDYLVNYAVGIRTLGELNLAERTLYYFRERVYQYCFENSYQEDLLFGQFIKLTREFAKRAGIIMDEQRMDTTMFMSNIKKAGRTSLAYDVLTQAVKGIPKERLTESLSKVLEPDFKTDVLYRSKAQESDSKFTLLLNLCNEALKILLSLPDAFKSEEVRIVRRFLSEQANKDNVTGKLTPRESKAITSASLQSAYDEDATYRKKGEVSQSGYVLEIAETCGKANTFQLITDYEVEPNIISDVEIIQDRLKPIRNNTGCTDLYVDGGFHSEDVNEAAQGNEIKIHLTDMSGTEPRKKIPVTQFDIDETTKVIKQCPKGHIPIRAGVTGGQSVAHFSHEACDNCDFREQCHGKRQQKDCVVRINIKAITVARERAEMKAAKKENTSMRAGIEGSNSALKRKGLNKLRVRGIVKSKTVCGLKVTAQNIKRYLRFLLGGYRPKKIKSQLQGVLVSIPG